MQKAFLHLLHDALLAVAEPTDDPCDRALEQVS